MTTPTTLAEVNHALRALSAKESLCAGTGHFYFSGGRAHLWPETRVMTQQLSDKTVQEWVAAWQLLRSMDPGLIAAGKAAPRR